MVSLSLSAHDHPTALRTMLRKLELAFATRVIFVFNHAHDLGDDIAATLNHHIVPNEDAEAVDLILVVEGRALHHRAADWDGSECSERGKFARASHLHEDVFHLGYT